MKIYVDDIPKNCSECEHCTKAHEGKFGISFCNVARMPIYNGQDIKGRGHHAGSLSDFDCPLQPTSNFETENKILDKVKSLEEQLKNSITPKFKIGQEVYYYHIARNKVYSGVIEDIQWFAIRDGIYYRIPKLQRDYFWIREDELFATREDAEKRLSELMGENK